MLGTGITRSILPWPTDWSRGLNLLFRFRRTRTTTILFPDGVLAIRKRGHGWEWKSLGATDFSRFPSAAISTKSMASALTFSAITY